MSASHDRYTHRMDWRLSHLDWEGQGGSSKQKKVLLEIILRFGLPSSLHSDNGTSFTSKVTQGVSKALGITYYLHCSWRPQSSGTSLCLVASVKRGNQLLNSAIKMITQETSLDGRRLYQYLSSAPILPLKNRLISVLMRCYVRDLLFMSMTSF